MRLRKNVELNLNLACRLMWKVDFPFIPSPVPEAYEKFIRGKRRQLYHVYGASFFGGIVLTVLTYSICFLRPLLESTGFLGVLFLSCLLITWGAQVLLGFTAMAAGGSLLGVMVMALVGLLLGF